MGFQVFIERARDATPAGVETAARSLAQRYSFPLQLILDRLRAGRFPAWSNLDYETARRCSAELESFGLVVSVVDEAAATAPMAPPVSYPTAPPTPDRAARRSSRPPVYTSGLAAAASGPATQDLGALGDVERWQIAALDGSVEEPPPPTRRPAPPIPAPATAATGTPPPVPVSAEEDDPFAPPASERQEVELEVPVAELASTPNPAAQVDLRPRPTNASVELPPAPPPPQTALARVVGAIASGRGHLVAGVAVALLLGFVPAHLVGNVRERGYAEIRAQVETELTLIDGPEAWDTAAVNQAAAQAAIESRHTSIVVSSVGLWMLGFAALLYGWLRVIDWERMAWRAGVPRPRDPGRA